jgi:mannose-6-phosphate isomerase
MQANQGVFPLKGVVQNYAWGGYNYIPELIKQQNGEQKPFAEYWLGAHPNYPSEVEGLGTLDKFISRAPETFLGKDTIKKFQGLPFLFKILDVRQMLSIQVHPDKESAKKEFENENLKGISLTARERNYRDDNHKPEMMVALGDFWLLHGFKNEKDLSEILERTAELQFLHQVFLDDGYRKLYEEVMLMPQEKVNEILRPLVKRILTVYEKNGWEKTDENFWAARAATTFCRNDQYDRGIFSIYFFNLVHLKKGEGVFQPEGMPHAYLEGQNVEVMANSDNVLRAGLTDKHIDVNELLKYVRFQPTKPHILKPSTEHTIYKTAAEEFELHHYNLEAKEQVGFKSSSAELYFVHDGNLVVNSDSNLIKIGKGQAVVISCGVTYYVEAVVSASVYRVIVPS